MSLDSPRLLCTTHAMEPAASVVSKASVTVGDRRQIAPIPTPEEVNTMTPGMIPIAVVQRNLPPLL